MTETPQTPELFSHDSVYDALVDDEIGSGDITGGAEEFVELWFQDQSDHGEDDIDFYATLDDISDFVDNDIIPKALQPKAKRRYCLSGLAEHARLRRVRQAAELANMNGFQNMQIEAELTGAKRARDRASHCNSTTQTALHITLTSFKLTEVVKPALSPQTQGLTMITVRAQDGPLSTYRIAHQLMARVGLAASDKFSSPAEMTVLKIAPIAVLRSSVSSIK